MTGSTIGFFSKDATGDAPPEKRKRCGATSRNADLDLLMKDTIYLHNPDAFWPQRCLERRRIFQNLFHRYYRQILYGCSNPRCNTPTCQSHQRRVSKGPFRSYTVLSARALATFLASQDHPEKGLCPYAPLKSHGSCEIASEHQDVKDIKIKLKDSSSSNSGSKQACTVHSPKFHKREQKKWSPDLALQLDGHGEGKIQHISASLINTTGSDVKQDQPSDQEAKKDPKSFTQSLFDTASMKIFQFASIPDGFRSWKPWLGSREEAAANDLDQSEDNAVISEKCSKSRTSLVEDAIEDIAPVKSAEVFVQPDTCHPRTGTGTAFQKSTLCSDIVPETSKDHHQANRPSPINNFSLSKSTGLPVCTGSNLAGVTSQLAVALYRSESQIMRAASEIPRGLQSLPVEWHLPGTKLHEDNAMYAQCKVSHVSSEAAPGPNAAPSLSHFSNSNVTGLVLRILNEFPEYPGFVHLFSALDLAHPPVTHASVIRGAESDQAFISYVRQSISYVLSNTESLLQSFVICRTNEDGKDHIQSTGFVEIVDAFTWLHKIDLRPMNILPSLWISSGNVYKPGSSRNKTMANSKRRGGANLVTLDSPNLELPLNDAEAAHVVEINLAALVASIPECSSETWMIIQQRRACGQLTSLPLPSEVPLRNIIMNEIPNVMDSLDDEMAITLMTRLVKAVASRRYTAGMLHYYAMKPKVDRSSSPDFINLIGNKLESECRVGKSLTNIDTQPFAKDRGSIERSPKKTDDWQGGPLKKIYLQQVVEWARGVILREWDGKPEVSRCGAVGGALELMNILYDRCVDMLGSAIFRTPFLLERLDVLQIPVDWANSETDRTSVHLLSYPFLFPASTKVSYFRAINYDTMNKAFETSMYNVHLQSKFNSMGILFQVSDRLKESKSLYLVLEIRREDVLTDAMNQLWRRHKRELLRPLKIRMGEDEGEEGVDLGGVQQEFFRIAIAEALDPKYGAFTTDPQTRMSWFQPSSLEPLYKFEMLGLLISLAIYNGLTLPFTFPKALYMKLLKVPFDEMDHIETIEDGWPELAKGLKVLRDWPGDDVEEVFMRSYTFSVDVFGSTVDVNLDAKRKSQRQPNTESRTEIAQESSPETTVKSANSPEKPGPSQSTPDHGTPTSETPMVTNANRHRYVHDYIHYLLHTSVAAQYDAFARGFHTCLNSKSLTLFQAPALKALIEGHPHINTHDLQSVTRYEGGYHHRHHTVLDFWSAVHAWGTEEGQVKVRQLLEFVTASDRLPVGGVERVVFVVQKNGVGDGRLPTSLTCFGRLLLPEFSGVEKMREALGRAVENSRGFGQP